MKNTLDLLEVLDYLDPAELCYQDWLSVGMGLKEAGYPVSAWDEWSRRDGARYHSSECEKKWESFKGSADPVTAGTIIQIARSRGWQTARSEYGASEQHGHEMDWDDWINLDTGGTMGVVDRNWLEPQEIAEPECWEPEKDLIQYLEILFNPNEFVGYVTRSFEKDGKHLPTKGCYDRTAGQMVEELKK